MGRFYRTAQAQFVDKNIYTPPAELMAKVIGNADSQIAKNEDALLSLEDKLQAQGLQADEPRLKEIINGYKASIEEMAKKVQEDPLAFRKEMGKIKQLGRSISEDWTQGEVSKIQRNKASRDAWLQDHLERAKKEKGYVSQDDITFAQQRADKMFQGTNFKGPGDYQTWQQETLNPFVNLEDISEERAKGYFADSVTTNGAYTDGKYMYTSEDKTKFVPFDTIKQGVLTSMLNDKELMAYYGQQVRLGRYTQDEVAEKLQSSADRVAGKYSFTEKEGGRKSISGDPFALKAMEHANQWKLKMADWNREDTKSIAGPAIDANIRTAEQLDILNRDFSASLNTLASKLGVKSTRTDGKLTPKDVRTKIETLKRLAKTPEQKKAIEEYGQELDNTTSMYNSGKIKASWSGFAAVHDNEVTANAQKAFEKITKDPRNLYDKPMQFTINGKKFKDATLYDIYNRPTAYGLDKDTFNIIDEMGEVTKRDIKEVFVQGSQVPAMVSDKKEDWMYNDMIFEFEAGNANIEGQTSFGNLGIDYSK